MLTTLIEEINKKLSTVMSPLYVSYYEIISPSLVRNVSPFAVKVQ